MRKLKLDVDRLAVESFEAEPAEIEGRGTVRAHAPTNIHAHTCDPLVGTCFGFTCYRTCICTGPGNPGGSGNHVPA
jgi:hypothetical protein